MRDHRPPHFHAIHAEHEAQIDIATGEIIKGKLPQPGLRHYFLDLHEMFGMNRVHELERRYFAPLAAKAAE